MEAIVKVKIKPPTIGFDIYVEDENWSCRIDNTNTNPYTNLANFLEDLTFAVCSKNSKEKNSLKLLNKRRLFMATSNTVKDLRGLRYREQQKSDAR